MVYRNYHNECDVDCNRLTAYIRVEGKWTKVGLFGTGCKQFELLDLAKEEEERLVKQRVAEVLLKVKQMKKESRDAIAQIRQANETTLSLTPNRKLFCPSNDDVTP